MKTDKDTYRKIENLLSQYLDEIADAKSKGLLTEKTVKTYTLHSANFVKWCADNFEPGSRNK